MKKTNVKGFSAVELLIVLVFLGTIAGAAWLVYNRQKSTQSTTSNTTQNANQNEKDSEAAREDMKEYKNADLGILFAYPKKWGTVTADRGALNNEAYEKNLPYRITFSATNSPYLLIFPSDWSFNPPGASEWRQQLTIKGLRSSLSASSENEYARGDNYQLNYFYAGFSGTLEIEGKIDVSIPKAKASGVEYRYGTSLDFTGEKHSCMSGPGDATPSCFADDLLEDIKYSMISFRTM